MQSVGQLLKDKRSELGLSLEEVEKNTKIRKNVLANLEENKWEALPSPTFSKGFIKNYGQFLGLDTNKLLALFRREVDEKKAVGTKKIFPTRFLPRFGFRPQMLVIAAVTLVLLGFFGYIFSAYQSLLAPPYLEIIDPADNVRINSKQVNVVGRTDNDAILKINGQKIDLSPGGTFSVPVDLPEGKSTIMITSENKFGGLTRLKRDVEVTPQIQPSSPPISLSPTIASTSATPTSVTPKKSP